MTLHGSINLPFHAAVLSLAQLEPIQTVLHLSSAWFGMCLPHQSAAPLLQAYLRKAAPQIVAANQLQGLLGVFQKLIASKALDHEGYKLLDSILEHVRLAGLQQFLPTVSSPCYKQSDTEHHSQHWL